MNRERLVKNTKAWAAVVAKAWSDEKFKNDLLKDTNATLKDQGYELDEGIQYQMHENTDHDLNLIIPYKKNNFSFDSIKSFINDTFFKK